MVSRFYPTRGPVGSVVRMSDGATYARTAQGNFHKMAAPYGNAVFLFQTAQRRIIRMLSKASLGLFLLGVVLGICGTLLVR